MRRFIVGLWAIVMAICIASCGTTDDGTSPADRAVTLTTSACGHASRTSGAGVIVEDGWVLASAHVVIGAGSIDVSGPFGVEPAEIAVVDIGADLALLRVPTARATKVRLADANEGDDVEIFGKDGLLAGTAEVERRVEVRIEGVRSTDRVQRLGYEIATRVDLGDSGGGVYKGGALVGVIFGRHLDDPDRSFVVRREPIFEVLEADRSRVWTCDSELHRIVSTS